MKVLSFRTVINQILGDLLGKYVLPTVPATRIQALYVAGEKGVPETWRVEGIEAVILETPDYISRPLLGQAMTIKRWTLFLTGWNDNPLDDCVGRLLRYFPGSTVTRLSSPESQRYPRVRVTILDEEIQPLLVYQGTPPTPPGVSL